MARTKAKNPKAASSPIETPKATSNQGKTGGFYKKNKEGNALHFAPTAVHYPGGSILVANHAEYTYPVEGWTYYESEDEAYTAEGLPQPTVSGADRMISAERIAARRAMTREEKEAERAQREAERIARLERTNPEMAAKVKARVEQRETLRVEREAKRVELQAAAQARLAAREAARSERVVPNEVVETVKAVKKPRATRAKKAM